MEPQREVQRSDSKGASKEIEQIKSSKLVFKFDFSIGTKKASDGRSIEQSARMFHEKKNFSSAKLVDSQSVSHRRSRPTWKKFSRSIVYWVVSNSIQWTIYPIDYPMFKLNSFDS